MTRKYTKAEAIGIVVRCAQTYKQELDGKNLLFICTDKHKKTIPIELCKFRAVSHICTEI